MISPNDRLKKLDGMGAYYQARFVRSALSLINWLIKARTNRGPVPPKDLVQHQFIRVGVTKYEVDAEGVIRNKKTARTLKPFAHGEYVAVKVHHEGSRRSVPVHQIVGFTLFGEKMFEGHRCLTHRDGDRKNNRLDNIILATRQELASSRVNEQARSAVEDAVRYGMGDKTYRQIEEETGVNRGNIWRMMNVPLLRGEDHADVQQLVLPYTEDQFLANSDNEHWLMMMLLQLFIGNPGWSIDELMGLSRRLSVSRAVAGGAALLMWQIDTGGGRRRLDVADAQ